MNVLAMFARHWQAERVKTRLAAVCGDAAARQVYRAFLRCLLDRFAASADQRWLAITPPESHGVFAEFAGIRWQLIAQTSGDLGQRMGAVMSEAFRRGAQRVVLIGSDAPLLPPAQVQQAFDLLEHVSVVLAPADDGGYGLIAARYKVPPVFEEIAWSTDQVCSQTLARLDQAGLAYELLPACYDIDTAADLERLLNDLREASQPGFVALREEITAILRG